MTIKDGQAVTALPHPNPPLLSLLSKEGEHKNKRKRKTVQVKQYHWSIYSNAIALPSIHSFHFIPLDPDKTSNIIR
jgi:hypothetical protein